jgi:class 3 adenylate cyclase
VVNLSARLCSHAEAGTILVTKTLIAGATKGKFVGKKLEPIRVKGKEKPIDVFQITGMKV